VRGLVEHYSAHVGLCGPAEAGIGAQQETPLGAGDLIHGGAKGSMADELSPEAQADLAIRLQQFDKELAAQAAKINADGGEKRKVYELVRRWLDKTIDAIAGEWVKVGLDVGGFARQMDRVQTALLEESMSKYSFGCRVLGDWTPADELVRSLEDDLRYVLSVRTRGWCRRNNQRLLVLTKGRGQAAPLFSESVASELRGAGHVVLDFRTTLGKPAVVQPQAAALANGSDEDGADRRSAVQSAAALGVKSGTAKQEDTKPRLGKERKGDASLLAGKRAVNFETAEQYLGIGKRQRQTLVSSGALKTEGLGQNRKITTDSLKSLVPPESSSSK